MSHSKHVIQIDEIIAQISVLCYTKSKVWWSSMPVGHSQRKNKNKKKTHATTENNTNRLLQILHCAASGQPRPAICCISGLVLIDAHVSFQILNFIIAMVVLFDWFDLFLCIQAPDNTCWSVRTLNPCESHSYTY